MTTTTYNLTRYARCEIEELQLLEKYKVSGTATRIYLILRSFAREKIAATEAELKEERVVIADLLS